MTVELYLVPLIFAYAMIVGYLACYMEMNEKNRLRQNAGIFYRSALAARYRFDRINLARRESVRR